MKDSRKTELTMEMMENAAGGGWEQLIPYGMEILDKVMNSSSGGSENNPAPANSEPGYNQNNSNNSGAQQNSQGEGNYNTDGMNVNNTSKSA